MVAIVITNLGGGGAERLLVNTIPAYVKLNIKVELIVVNQDNQQDFYFNALSKHCNIINLNRHRYNPLLILDFVRRLKKYKVCHVHLLPANIWVALASFFLKGDIKFIHTDHGLVNKKKVQNWMGRSFIRFIYNRYQNIICITEAIAQKVKKEIGISSAIHYIPNGIDIAKIDTVQALPKEHIKDLPINHQNKILIMMTSRLHTGKRHDLFLKLIKNLGPNYVGLLLGVESLSPELEELTKTYNIKDRIIPLGFRNNPYELMKTVDINVLLSDYEGMSGVVIESMACKRPFFGSDVSGINNLVPNEELVSNQLEELKNRIEKCVTDPLYKNNLIEKGYAKSQEFSLDNMVAAYAALYKS